MDFTRRPRHRIERKPETEDLAKLYPHNVMMYKYPPMQDISLQEFEDLALERLKLLRIFEQASSKNLRILSPEWKETIEEELSREGMKSYIRLLKGNTGKEGDLQARRKDYISHFILRLAYCRSPDLKRWFITREMEIFKYKFSSLLKSEVKQFLELNKFEYTPLTEEQKDEVKDGLYESTMGQGTQHIEQLEFYKVHFTEVLDLIKSRRCYVKGGFAYVSTDDFISIVGGKLQLEIEKGLTAAQRLLPEIEDDERLFHLLKSLHTSYTGKDYTLNKNNAVPIEALDQLSKKSFPLCMRMCHETLRTKHHHKFGGRMQYGLFLKGIGVTLEDSLKFWREEFTKIMDLERFEKNYSYAIRHNYGKEGSMINYTPYSCMKIITTNVGPQETHGCPFKIYDQSALKLKLASYGLSAAHVQEVSSFAAKGHYQIACAKYFEITHETKIEQGINHPNQYFELSQTVMGNREPKGSNVNTPARKKRLRPVKKENVGDASMLADEDDELWLTAETQENEYNQTIIRSSNDATKSVADWEDDFDITQVEDIEMEE